MLLTLPRYLVRFRSVVCALILSAVLVFVGIFAVVKPAFAATTCTPFGTITMGKYWLNNNLWGQGSGSGTQCISDTSISGSNIAWSTNWNWTGQSNSVKSYDSSVLGWQWGWMLPNTGLPVQLSSRASVQTSWSFNLTQNNTNTLDVSYDTWLSPNGSLGNANPSDEVMVWLYAGGGAGPAGSYRTTLNVDGTSWNLYEGTASWNIISFVRTSNTTSASLNLMDFYSALVSLGYLSNSEYLLSVQSGTEVFTGSGQLNTTSYSTNVGGSSGTTPTPTPTQGTTPTPTPTHTGGTSCSVHYAITNQWQGGFGTAFTITNTGSTAINGWHLQFSFPNGQTITQLWNGSYTQSSSAVTISNVSYNASLPPGASLSSEPGFNGTLNGTNSPPTAFMLNGTACAVV